MMSRLCHVWHRQIFGIRDIGKEQGGFLHTHIIHLAFTLLILANMNDGTFPTPIIIQLSLMPTPTMPLWNKAPP